MCKYFILCDVKDRFTAFDRSDWPPNYQLKMKLEGCGMFVSHLFFYE